MATLIVVVLSGVIFSYFATLNTASVAVNLAGSFYTFPLYLIVLGSLLLGLLIAGLISFVDSIAAGFAISQRDHKLEQSGKNAEGLRSRIKELEIENAKIKSSKRAIESDEIVSEEYPRKRTLMEKLRHNLSA